VRIIDLLYIFKEDAPHNSVLTEPLLLVTFCQAFHYKLDVLLSKFQFISSETDLVKIKGTRKDVVGYGCQYGEYSYISYIGFIVTHSKHTLTSKLKVRQTERQRDRFDTFYQCQGSLSELLSEHFVRHNHTHQRTMVSHVQSALDITGTSLWMIFGGGLVKLNA